MARSSRPPTAGSGNPDLGETPVPASGSEWFDGPTRVNAQFAQEPVRFGRLIGRSAVMRTLFAVLERAAESDATVLLEGETGTGKDAIARALHEASPRREGPFVVVTAARFPRS